jgi:hypothetical protein
MTEKQFIGFLRKIEQIALPALEKEIMRLYKDYLKRCGRGTEQLLADKIKLCLNERKRRLNKIFSFTPENVKRIEQINALLIEATKTLYDKTIEIDQQMGGLLQTSDGYLHDYSIEATLKVDCESDDTMAEILDEFSCSALRSFLANNTGNDAPETITDNLDDFHWNDEELSTPELNAIPHFCYASHTLFCHLFYSYSDCIGIKAFRNEVNVCCGNNIKIGG